MIAKLIKVLLLLTNVMMFQTKQICKDDDGDIFVSRELESSFRHLRDKTAQRG